MMYGMGDWELRGMNMNQMRSRTTAMLAAALFLAAGKQATGQSPTPTIASYLSSARTAAGMEWAGTMLRLCIPPLPAPVRSAGPPREAPARETWHAEPVKVADNLYFLGTRGYSSWAIVGREGIILIEAAFDYSVKDEIVEGMKKLGLNIADVKYLILSHAHADHDGGAKFLQDSIDGVHLLYGAEDWDLIEKTPTHAGGKPKRDKTADDGMVVSVGDASVRVVTMPGHTAGTLSYLFEVRDNGKPMRVAYVGGTAIPFNGTAEFYDRYIASSRKMEAAAKQYGATALISNHSEFDDAFFKAQVARNRASGEPNPFDVGADGVARYFKVIQDCATAARIRATGK